jgi:hypothetical protein
MVAEGWAIAYRHYSRDYVATENVARAARKGLWNGTFENPRAVRDRHKHSSTDHATRGGAESAAPAAGCRIKGNINGQGERIYHVPGQEHYAETQINPARGERWFCTETEAVAAGWRRARS